MPQIILEVSERQLLKYQQAFEGEMTRQGINGHVVDAEALLRDCLMADLDEPHTLVRRHVAEDALDDLAGLKVS